MKAAPRAVDAGRAAASAAGPTSIMTTMQASDDAGGLAQTLARGIAPERSVAPEPVAEESGDTGPKLIDADN